MKRTDILNQIISKGGMMGAAARLYINDAEKGDGFIRECYEQCHNTPARKLWGEELVSEIERYVLNPLSYSEKRPVFDMQNL